MIKQHGKHHDPRIMNSLAPDEAQEIILRVHEFLIYIYNLINGLIVWKLYVIKAKSKMILQFLAHLKAMSIPPFSKGGSIISIKTKKKSEKHKESITWEQYCNGHPDPSHLIQRESVKINNFSDGQKAVIFNTLRSA